MFYWRLSKLVAGRPVLGKGASEQQEGGGSKGERRQPGILTYPLIGVNYSEALRGEQWREDLCVRWLLMLAEHDWSGRLMIGPSWLAVYSRLREDLKDSATVKAEIVTGASWCSNTARGGGANMTARVLGKALTD